MTKASVRETMRHLLLGVFIIILVACASKTRRSYPDNGSVNFLDISASTVGGNLDSTDVTVHYKGSLKDSIEDLGVVSGSGKTKTDVLKELIKEAAKLKADGIYEIDVAQNGDTFKADGVAFRFKNK